MQLADISGFYRAFGFRAAGERPDHIVPQLEFVALLYAKEAYAFMCRDHAGAAVCSESREKFVREHMSGWLPSFVAETAAAGGDPLHSLAELATSVTKVRV